MEDCLGVVAIAAAILGVEESLKPKLRIHLVYVATQNSNCSPNREKVVGRVIA